MRVLHVAESIRGGCGTYINEVVPLQVDAFGAANVCVLAPDEHSSQLADVASGAIRTFRRPGRATGLIFLTVELFTTLRLFRPDVIHAHSTFAGAIVRTLAIFLPSMPPIVYCPHGWVFDTARTRAARWWMEHAERLQSRRSSVIVCISQAEKAAAEQAGIQTEKLTVILNGLRPLLRTQVAATWSDSRLKVLFVGRLDRQKGADILIEAVRALERSVAVRIVGEAVLSPEVRSRSSPHIEYLGWLDQDGVAAQIRACDIVVMPSRWEGFGLVAIEAMRLGKPVIASAVGGLSEIVVEGVTGRLVPVGDSRALRKALTSDTTATRAQMGLAGLRRFSALYTIDRTHAQLASLYQSLVGMDTRPTPRSSTSKAFETDAPLNRPNPRILLTCSSISMAKNRLRASTRMRHHSQARSIYINGRFLTQRTGGVQRFAREIVKALDVELQSNNCRLAERDWILVVPRGTETELSLRRIAIKVTGGCSGHVWDQLVLLRAARGGVIVNLTNSAPLLHPRSLVIIHDAAVFRTPRNFAPVYALLHRLLGLSLSRTSTIGTVSEFSRQELAAVFRLDRSKISLVQNSCEHLSDIAPVETVLERLRLMREGYFLFVGKPSPNKNLTAAMTAFHRLQCRALKFVIVGTADSAVFRSGFDKVPEGVVIADHVSDGELVALFRSATALIFPSLYEGFGIPPLEGMVTGCAVLAARIPPVLEVCGNAVLYFDPMNADSLVEAMQSILSTPNLRSQLIRKGNARARMFSWQRSARQLIDAIANADQSWR